MVKNPPTNVGDVRDTGSILGWKIPWRRAWQPALVFFPGECRGQGSLAGYSSWGCKESDTTEVTYAHTRPGFNTESPKKPLSSQSH